jgi:hypothetical protein
MNCGWVAPALACLLTAAGCGDTAPTGPTVALNERFTLAPGELATVDGTSLRVQFVRVASDSRCPADVVCIQMGDAAVELLVNGAPYDLHTFDERRSSVTVGGVQIELVELQPYPVSSRQIQPGEYRATLRASR